MNQTAAYLIVIGCSLLGGIGQVFFKLGSKNMNVHDLLNPIISKYIYLGLMFYGLATIIYMYCLRFGNLHVMYSLIAFSYIWVAIMSRLYLKETLTFINYMGFVVILIGIGLTTR